MQRFNFILAMFILPASLAAPALAADDDMWKLLQRGGQVVLMRHAQTTPGVGDPEGMALNDCATQRNLNDEGRAQASRVGEAIRARGIAVARLVSSPWCRCIDTARLVFGRSAEVSSALGNLFDRPGSRAAQLAELRPWVSRVPSGGNLFMVTHGSTVLALTGVSPATAEMVILTPQPGGKFVVAGRLEVPAR